MSEPPPSLWSRLAGGFGKKQAPEVAHALSFPWCWPSGEWEAAVSGPAPASPEVGDVLLVSASGTRARLWRGRAGAAAVSGAVLRPLVGDAAGAAALAWQIASRDAPVVIAAERLARPPSWWAEPIAKHGPGPAERVLDGRSYGLALALGAVSTLAQQPCPASVVALATVDVSGRTGGVGGLRDKLAIVAGWALGVKSVLVAPCDERDATALGRSLCRPLEVIAVASVAEAAEHLWPNLAEAAGWPSTEAAGAALAVLFRQAVLDREPLLGWQAVRLTAERLAEVFEGDDEKLEMAHVVEAIAGRHLGLSRELREPKHLGDQPLPLRRALAAHILQAATDGFVPWLREAIAAALAVVPPRAERHTPDLELLGAVVRALAVAGDHDEAIRLGREVVEQWFEHLQPAGANRPLCELIRVLGLSGRGEELDRVVRELVVALRREPGVRAADRAFLALALGRAFVQLGRHGEARAALADGREEWGMARNHVRWGRLRWLARAEADPGAAAAHRQRLEDELGHDELAADPNLHLARLDAALDAAGDPTPHVEALLAGNEAREFEHILAGRAPREAAADVAERYRY